MKIKWLTRTIFGTALVGFVVLGVYLFYRNIEVFVPSKQNTNQETDLQIITNNQKPINILYDNPKKPKRKTKPIDYLKKIKQERQEKLLKIIFYISAIVLLYFIVTKIKTYLSKNATKHT